MKLSKVGFIHIPDENDYYVYPIDDKNYLIIDLKETSPELDHYVDYIKSNSRTKRQLPTINSTVDKNPLKTLKLAILVDSYASNYYGSNLIPLLTLYSDMMNNLYKSITLEYTMQIQVVDIIVSNKTFSSPYLKNLADFFPDLYTFFINYKKQTNKSIDHLTLFTRVYSIRRHSKIEPNVYKLEFIDCL